MERRTGKTCNVAYSDGRTIML